jgi:putative phosphoribosyl transferase
MAWIEPFRDRRDAGRQLAARLEAYRSRDDVLILALPRGGVPVAAEVAKALGLPFDLLLVRKLGIPGCAETAMGAIAANGVCVMNEDLIQQLDLTRTEINEVKRRETEELARRERLYRAGKPPIEVTGKTVIVIDDGIATGATMQAAILLLRRQGARRIIVATPVAPPDTARKLAREVDEMIVVAEPEEFSAVGEWYRNFGQTGDDEVRRLLAEATSRS